MRLAWILFSLTFALFVVQATGGFEAALGTECAQGCTDDDESGRCADSCSDCACCFHPRPIARAQGLPPLGPALADFAPREAPPAYPSAPPGDILHVPRSSLA